MAAVFAGSGFDSAGLGGSAGLEAGCGAGFGSGAGAGGGFPASGEAVGAGPGFTENGESHSLGLEAWAPATVAKSRLPLANTATYPERIRVLALGPWKGQYPTSVAGARPCITGIIE